MGKEDIPDYFTDLKEKERRWQRRLICCRPVGQRCYACMIYGNRYLVQGSEVRGSGSEIKCL